ncbi:hypothetical protein [Actinomycetospora sp. CA-053990]|uniref:hypothetical protein n=1 Tax=Actinomycetospora sp. CA-053990 TaxID=3239891 RepID=UPI003D9202E2
MAVAAGRVRACLTVYRWVAFAGPRTTTGVGVVLLGALTVPQLTLLSGRYPGWVRVWAGLAVAVALLAVTVMLGARSRPVAGLGWFAGSAVCAVSIALWVLSRTVGLPGVVGALGRWDHPGATAALGLAALFLLLHGSLLLGVTVARPGHRHWHD